MARKLSPEEITEALAHLPGWERQDGAISRSFDRGTFKGAIAFVTNVAELADQADHHPDLDIRYQKVKVMLTTHDLNGLSDADIELARRIQAASE